jgi:hypothetical protein
VSHAFPASPIAQKLRELIAAIDRRVPHAERSAETGIAHDAAALKARALSQLEKIEQRPDSVE